MLQSQSMPPSQSMPQSRGTPQSRGMLHIQGLAGLLVAVLLLPLLCTSVGATDARVRVYAGGGWFVPTDDGVREAYDGGLALTAGLGLPVFLDRTWFTLEASYLKNSGQEFVDDPTFEPGTSRYWLVPLSVGLRFDIRPPDTSRADALLGLQVLAIPTRFEDPIRGDEKGSTLGVALELRSDVPLGSRWLAWIRSRWLIAADVNYERIPTLSVNGLTIELGLGGRVGRDPEGGSAK